MTDLKKYLENQLLLSKSKCTSKKISENSLISEKSRKTAERISKKQRIGQDIIVPDAKIHCSFEPSAGPSAPVAASSDSGSEYVPSCEEAEEEDLEPPHVSAPSISVSRANLKRVLDDGDYQLYVKRLETWKNNLGKAHAGVAEEELAVTADIAFVLSGNKDCNENYKLSSGLIVPTYLWKQLYKYQRAGVKWLWELHQVKSGGLLGDEMGLGKTVQIIAFLAGLSKSDSGHWGGLGPSMIIAPATVIYQWVSHFHYWSPFLRVAVLHSSGSYVGNINRLIKEIHEAHGVLLITYAGIVKYNSDLLGRNWHYIILDEGHKIRNPDTQVSKMVKKFSTPHKIIITGSPMQNSLQELWSLFDFMIPGLLGTQSAFLEFFSIPITQGGYANATSLQEVTALELARSLKNTITPYMIRRTKAEVQEHIRLPEKSEQVLFCSLSQEQRDLYLGYLMSGTVRSILDKENRYGDPLRARILVALSTLRKICNHPDLYIYEAHDESEFVDENTFGFWKRAGKMTVVHSLLKIWQKQGHRALIFSQSRAMLCILEQYLLKSNYKYLKMDGTVSVGIRQNIIKTFNENSEYLVFLATTQVGGLGVNLTGADRVIIYDPDWNPATDSQAKERAWRIGQQRNVTVYRLLSAGTIEEKIYQRQVFKNLLSNKILIDPNQKNVLRTSTLQGLFTLEELNKNGDTETASIFSHTKVDVRDSQKKDHYLQNSGHLSHAQKKIDAMRKKAREISRNISKTLKKAAKSDTQTIDPRERYKKKREILLNPPKIEEPEINLMNDEITEAPFDRVISELDIVNMHSKKDYVDQLIKQALQKEDNLMESDEEQLVENSVLSVDDAETTEKLDVMEPTNEIKQEDSSGKRKLSASSDEEIENLVAVKKVKKKKHKKEKKENDDDYVLSKLFAKSNVKNALHHDEVVGLAEKEKRYQMKEEASKTAKHALRAIRKSTKKRLPI